MRNDLVSMNDSRERESEKERFYAVVEGSSCLHFAYCRQTSLLIG